MGLDELLFVVDEDADGFFVFVASCPSRPGCVSQGTTREEAEANIRESIAAYDANLAKHGETV